MEEEERKMEGNQVVTSYCPGHGGNINGDCRSIIISMNLFVSTPLDDWMVSAPTPRTPPWRSRNWWPWHWTYSPQYSVASWRDQNLINRGKNNYIVGMNTTANSDSFARSILTASLGIGWNSVGKNLPATVRTFYFWSNRRTLISDLSSNWIFKEELHYRLRQSPDSEENWSVEKIIFLIFYGSGLHSGKELSKTILKIHNETDASYQDLGWAIIFWYGYILSTKI